MLNMKERERETTPTPKLKGKMFFLIIFLSCIQALKYVQILHIKQEKKGNSSYGHSKQEKFLQKKCILDVSKDIVAYRPFCR